ncbi:MAG: PAS domain S-box protein, partial [Candidatus Aminicenantales bacterium]
MDNNERRAGMGYLLVFMVLAAGIVASGFFFYGNFKRHFRAEIESQLSAVAELKVSELVDWRAQRLGDASIFYKNASFSGLVRQFFEKPKDPAARDQLRTWLSHVQAAYEYSRIFLLDVYGVERISAPDAPEPVAADVLEQAPEVLRSGKIIFVDFDRDAPGGPIHMSILAPVLEGGEGPRALGILVLNIDPQRYLYPYIQRWPTASRTAETLIVRRDGNAALYLNELRFQKNTALNLRIPLGNKNVPAVMAVLGQEGVVEGMDYRGAPVLAAVRAVPDSPWFLVARMDIAEAYAPLRAREWVIIVLVVSLILGAGAGTGFLWRRQRAHFYREKYEAGEALSVISKRQEALLSAVPDIIMEVDDKKVYTLANQAGIAFFGDDVIGKEAAFYFEGEQETYKTIQPLFDGSENMIYVESWQRRKDGEKRLLAWWCRVLKDKSGQVIGALSSARDITEQTGVEDALRKSEERFRSLYENSTLGLYRTTPDGRIVMANPALVKMLGYSSFDDLANRDLKKDGFEPSYPRAEFVETIKKEGAVRGLESAWKRRDGTTIFVRESARAIRDAEGQIAYFDGTVEDITDRKRAEEALAYEQSLLSALMDNSPDQVYFKDADSRFVKISKAQAERLGLSDPAQAVGKTDADFFAADHARTALEDEQRVMITGRPLVDLEELETWPDGRVAWVSTTKVPLRDGHGRVIGTFGISRDITKRKAAEERLKETLQRLRQ